MDNNMIIIRIRYACCVGQRLICGMGFLPSSAHDTISD